MDRWKGKVAVVTGASAGIGLAIAKALVKEGMIVIGLARRKQKMIEEMKKVCPENGCQENFHAVQCDVSKESEVVDAMHYVEEHFKQLDVLINNAGVVKIKSIQQADIKELEEVIGVNLMGVVYCYKHGVELMKKNSGEGYIININSVEGHKVTNPALFPVKVFTNVYPATKFGMTALSEVFTNELKDGRKIRVTNISPGYVITDIVSNLNSDLPKPTSIPALEAEDIANAVIYVIGTPSHVQITQLTIKPLGEMF